MNDLIRREDALDLLNEQINHCDKALSYLKVVPSKMDEYAFKIERASLIAYKEQLESIPSVQLEQQWTPCNVDEQPPEEGRDVLITKKAFKIKGYEQEVIKAKRSADPRSGKIEWRSEFGALTDKEVLAWMPLPKAYKEQGRVQNE